MQSRRIIAAGVGVAVAGGVLLGLSLLLGLNGDVQYVIGVQDVRGGGMSGALGTFAHRPVLYRVFVGALDNALQLIGLRPSALGPYEAVFRLAAVIVAVLAAWLLARGLRERLGRVPAAWTSIAVALALVFAPSWDFLQPEWVATLFGVMAIGAALWPRRAVVAGGFSGGLLVAAFAAKISTAPIALLALLTIAVLDRRRAAAATVGGAGWLAVGLVLLALFPLERRWLADMISLNPYSPLRSGISIDQLSNAMRSLGSKAALSPAVLLMPAAAVVASRFSRGRWRTAGWAAAATIAALLTAATMIAQGEPYYPYHLAALPILAAGLCGYAAGRWAERGAVPVALPITLAATAAAGAWLMTTSNHWRLANLDLLVWILVGIAAVLALLASQFLTAPAEPASDTSRVEHAPDLKTGRGWLAGVMAAAGLAILPALLPVTAWSLDPRVTQRTNASWEAESLATHEAWRAMSEEIGQDTPVIYMAFGTVPYHMGNPTPCRYPSPLWLRHTDLDYVRRFFSYRDNEACLRSPTPHYLVLDPKWLPLESLLPKDFALVRRLYDCGSTALVESRILACPRRS